MTTNPHINAALVALKTHKVVTTFADGRTRSHETRSAATAENYAVLERRKIGRMLIDRESGISVRVTSVDIVALTAAETALSVAQSAINAWDKFGEDEDAASRAIYIAVAQARMIDRHALCGTLAQPLGSLIAFFDGTDPDDLTLVQVIDGLRLAVEQNVSVQ